MAHGWRGRAGAVLRAVVGAGLVAGCAGVDRGRRDLASALPPTIPPPAVPVPPAAKPAPAAGPAKPAATTTTTLTPADVSARPRDRREVDLPPLEGTPPARPTSPVAAVADRPVPIPPPVVGPLVVPATATGPVSVAATPVQSLQPVQSLPPGAASGRSGLAEPLAVPASRPVPVRPPVADATAPVPPPLPGGRDDGKWVGAGGPPPSPTPLGMTAPLTLTPPN